MDVNGWEMEIKNKVNVCKSLHLLRVPEDSLVEGERTESSLKHDGLIISSLISTRELTVDFRSISAPLQRGLSCFP